MKAKSGGGPRGSLVSQAQFAKLRSVSRATVSMWKRDGHLVFRDGMVDVDKSNAKLAERPGKGRSGSDQNDNVILKSPSAGPDADAAAIAEKWLKDSGAPFSLSEARRLKENFLMQKHKVELDLLTGAVLDRDAVQEVLAAILSVCRQVFLSVPSRGATLLEGVTTPLERQEILESLIDEVLDTLQHVNIEYVEDHVRKRGRRPKKTNGGATHEAQDEPQP